MQMEFLTSHAATLMILSMHGDGLWLPSHDLVPVEEHRYKKSKALADLSIIHSMYSAATVKA